MSDYLKLSEIRAYRVASPLSDEVWEIVSGWKTLAQKTVGEQWIKATDSIAGNIAEGFGRHHKRDKVRFFYNARASVYESAHWAKKARQRGLIDEKQYQRIIKELRELPKEINGLIRSTMENLEE